MNKIEFLQKIQQKEAEELREYEKLENELVDKYRSYLKNNEKSNAVILVLIEDTIRISKTTFLVRMIKSFFQGCAYIIRHTLTVLIMLPLGILIMFYQPIQDAYIYYFSYIKTTIKKIIFCFKHKELIDKVLNHDKRKKYD